MDKTRYYYKDFVGKKTTLHYTCGRFEGWAGPGGLLNAYYAVFIRGSGEQLLIPEYSLTKETREILPKRKEHSC